MNTATGLLAADGTVYRDKKRYLWLVSLMIPFLAVAGPVMTLVTGQSFWLLALLIFGYVLSPILDAVIGQDTSNPPESVVSQLEEDGYYRWIVLAQVPVSWAVLIFGAWFVANHELAWYEVLVVAITNGVVGGFALNLGHELGHKKTKLERTMAKVVLAPAAYGHFFIEHNKGHHRDVATPEDPASSKMGETIYQFILREMPGAFRRAWTLEKDRLNAKGLSVWNLQNEVLQPLLLSVALYTSLAIAFGVGVLPFLAIAAFWSMYQLTSANYIEHYGLLRQKLADGRYERCQPHHSWNSNHLFSNWITFHLQRHSDHHANAARRYQSLRNFDDVPQLPSGYPGMFLLAYVPPLWFKVMNPRLVSLVGADANKINFLPRKKATLVAKYGLH